MNDVEILILRARLAAGCAWSSKPGETSNQTEPQEPEVRRILRECAAMLEALKKEAGDYAETIDNVRAALGQEATHYLVMPDDVKELVEAVERCADDGGCRAMTVLHRLRKACS